MNLPLQLFDKKLVGKSTEDFSLSRRLKINTAIGRAEK
jgi:hypothetical protein